MLEVFEKVKIRWVFIAFITSSIAIGIILGVKSAINGVEVSGTIKDIVGILINTALFIFIIIYYYKKRGNNRISFEAFKNKEAKNEITKVLIANIIFSFLSVSLISGILHYLNIDLLKKVMEESPFKSDNIFLIILGACVIAPIFEEVVFRGIVYTRLRCRFGNTAAIILAALIFGLLHISLAAVHAIIMGITFCIIFKKYNNIFINIILHCIHNILALAIENGCRSDTI